MSAFVYPARIKPAAEGGWLIAFRDFPEGLTQAEQDEDPVEAAEGCLQACLEGRLEDGLAIPEPSSPKSGEVPVAVPLETAAKTALFLAVAESGLSRIALARQVGLDEKEVRRMLDPRHSSKLPRIAKVLRALGKDLQLTVADAKKLSPATTAASPASLGARQGHAPYRASGKRRSKPAVRRVRSPLR